MELMGNDQPVASCGLHGATRRDVIEQAIEYLQKSLANTERDEPSGYGYRILLFMTWRANGRPHPNFQLHIPHRM